MGKRKWKQMTKTKEKRRTRRKTLFDLPVEDIMMTHVAQYLDVADLINLRLCSQKCKDLADVMFAGIRTFETYYNKKLGEGGLTLFLKKTRRLRLFEIRNKNTSDDTFHYVLSNNYLLNDVVIIRCPFVTSWGVMPLAEYCKNISYLELVCVPITDDFLRSLGRHKLLNLFLVINKEDKNKDSPSEAALQAFFEKQIIIEEVQLKLFTSDLSSTVSTIANFCPNLKSFDIHESVLSDDLVLIELADKCKNLDFLDVNKVHPSVSVRVLNELRSNKKYLPDMLNETDFTSDSSEYDTDRDDNEDSWNSPDSSDSDVFEEAEDEEAEDEEADEEENFEEDVEDVD